jgi:hypothetical protein
MPLKLDYMKLNLPFLYYYLFNTATEAGTMITAVIGLNKQPGSTTRVFGYCAELDDFISVSDTEIVCKIHNLKIKN